jgi:hypothetical protein
VGSAGAGGLPELFPGDLLCAPLGFAPFLRGGQGSYAGGFGALSQFPGVGDEIFKLAVLIDLAEAGKGVVHDF